MADMRMPFGNERIYLASFSDDEAVITGRSVMRVNSESKSVYIEDEDREVLWEELWIQGYRFSKLSALGHLMRRTNKELESVYKKMSQIASLASMLLDE